MPENVTNGDHSVEVKASGEVHENEEEVTADDVYFDPIITLPLIEVSNNEEEEVEMIKLLEIQTLPLRLVESSLIKALQTDHEAFLTPFAINKLQQRAKLYRYDSSSSPAEWKERGTGEVKLLRHKTKHTVRVVMRRDKTLKICANHFVTPWMELKPNCGSDRAWVWSVLADFADELLTSELLAIRFANAENAQLWKEAFEKAKKIVGTECEIYAGKSNPEDKDDDSDSDTCSYVTYSDDSDNDEPVKTQKEAKITEITDEKEQKEQSAEKEKSTEEVTEVMKKLEVSDKDEQQVEEAK